ncbi:MAG: sulfur oxidation c-type cytochrome SoxX [Gammaproteobacteria bacterium]|nr:sulfur oxidation c-type cytochrome SoxX [Gammaproteobacteria bacterium]
MQGFMHKISTTASVTALTTCLGLAMPLTSHAADDDTAQGKEIAFDRKKGNCLACHEIAGGDLAGNIGPPLVAMKARFPDFDTLKSQIYDARKNNPNTIMIPFGPHEVLSAKEIDLVTKFIHTL